jgi:phosphoglucosamine mutase
VREDVRVSKKEPFEKHQDIAKAIAAAQTALKDKGRVFVRYSGTEPLARVMVEGEDSAQITTLSKNIAGQIQRILG